MQVAQHILLAMAMLGLGGCVALNRGLPARAPRPAAERKLDLAAFVAEHNRNAELIESLEASPTIRIKGKMLTANADGRLAMVRPRNFSLLLKTQGVVRGNIGSNDEEFWFWVQSDKDKSIYWCDYAALESSPLAMTYQPDWIIEALGLQPISSDEAARITTREGKAPGTTALVFPPTRRGSESYTRMMIVSNYTLRIKELRIYTGNLQSLLAQADVSDFKDFELGSSPSIDGGTCYLPESMKLDWKREQLVFDVLLKDVEVNQFDSSRAAAIFVEPVVPGYERVNLAELSRTQQDGRTVRRTMPAPEPGNGTPARQPAPASEDGSTVPRLEPSVGQNGGAGRSTAGSRNSGGGQTAILSQSDRPRNPNQLEDLVTAPLPIAPETPAMQAANAAWSTIGTSPVGR